MNNRLKQMLSEGKVAVGAQLRLSSPAVAELFGLAGYDWLLIDSEHAPQTPLTIRAQLQALAATPATAIVRAAKNDPDLFRVYLDMGAQGIAAPFVNSAAEARLGADACRYPPRGTRGWGPSRASGYGLTTSDYRASADAEVMYVPIIESAEAVKNIDEILAVDGVDSFLIGPADLSFSLGAPLQFSAPVVQDAINTVLAAARRAGKPAGGAVGYGQGFDTTEVLEMVRRGYRLVLCGGDEPVLAAGTRLVLQNLASVRS